MDYGFELSIVAEGEKYSLAREDYQIIATVDKFIMKTGFATSSVVTRQLCKVAGEDRFFILSMMDMDTFLREHVQVWPVPKTDAAKIAEGFVDAKTFEKYFGDVADV